LFLARVVAKLKAMRHEPATLPKAKLDTLRVEKFNSAGIEFIARAQETLRQAN
jgi:hypothetical protein